MSQRINELVLSVAAICPGLVVGLASAFIPTGWLSCDGSAVSRITYAPLFAALGVTYGSGDGSTTFNLPDLRDRVPVGTSTGSLNGRPSIQVLGAVGGEETHILTINELAPHEHAISDPGHTHAYNFLALSSTLPGSPTTATGYRGSNFETTASTTGITGTLSSGLGSPHNNMQPFMVVNWIIKT